MSTTWDELSLQADRLVRRLLILIWDRAVEPGDDPLLAAAYDLAAFSQRVAGLPATKAEQFANEDVLAGLMTSLEEALSSAIGNGEVDDLAAVAVANAAREVAKSLRN